MSRVLVKSNNDQPGDNSITDQTARILNAPDGQTIAYHVLEGKAPGVMFLGGLMSDMSGTKAIALEAHCREAGRAFVRFDYFGHGESSGSFIDGTITRWRADTLAVLNEIAVGPQILVGSSMGGYVSAMACDALEPEALLLMAPALYLDGYPGEPAGCPDDTIVVHGWGDDIVPLDSSYTFAKSRRAALHVVADGHRLAESIEFIGALFSAQLKRALDRV